MKLNENWYPPGDRDIFDNFMANMAELDLTNFYSYRMDCHQYEDILLERGQPISFIHIDADHDNDYVEITLKKLKPLFRDFSVVCGHDAHHPPVQRSINNAGFTYSREAGLWRLIDPLQIQP